MTGYPTKNDLVAGWISEKAFEMFNGGGYASLDDARRVAKIMATMVTVYVPHIYRGGWVIREFGYSTERISVYVAPENCGIPECV
jgi:hypothetical protein